MNFDEMKDTWMGQFSNEAPIRAEALNATLAGRIRRNQQAYAKTRALAVATYAVGFGIIIGAIILEAMAGPHTSVRFIRGFALCLLGGTLAAGALTAVVLRRVPGMYSIRGDGARSLPDRIHRDARRYRMGMAMGDAQQVLGSLLVAALVLVMAIRTGLHGPLRWIAVALPLAPALDVLLRRAFRRAASPRPEQSLSEVLALSIQSTRRQVRRVKHSWWQGALPNLAGLFLGMEPLWLSHGAIRPFGWVMLSLYTVVLAGSWAVSRWALRRLLRPRLEELAQLQADLIGQ